MALILADTREDNGANPYLESETAENNKHNSKLTFNSGGGSIAFKIKRITVGDYCILVKDVNDKNKTILSAVIERKTWKDLSASIKDERITNQTKSMHEIHVKKGCLILYIIEGKMTYKDDFKISNIPFKNLHAKIRHNTIRGIPFLQSKDEQHTAKIIVDLARDILKLYRQGEINFAKQISVVSEGGSLDIGISESNLLINISQNNEQPIENNEIEPLKNQSESELLDEYCKKIDELNIMYKDKFVFNKFTPNIIDEIGKIIKEAKNPRAIVQETFSLNEADFSIPEEIKINKVNTDSDIILMMWNSIPNISPKSAIMLVNKYHISDIICCPEKNVEKIKNEIADLKFPSGNRFGDAKAGKVMELSYKGNDILKKGLLYDLSVKIISQIPGLSDHTAKAILDQYSLRDICNGFVQADMISEIKNKNNRKISLKSAEKLVELLLKPDIANMYN